MDRFLNCGKEILNLGKEFLNAEVVQMVSGCIETVYDASHILSGAVDIIVVQQEDGEFKSSPFYVQFGLCQGVLQSWKEPTTKEKVTVSVNDVDANFHMYLNGKGKAEFLKDDSMKASRRETEDCAVLSPSSQQLASLGLKEGRNKITFTCPFLELWSQTQLSQIEARIYLWKWNARIVIVDVDGTVTKSDAIGWFAPLIGKDWTQPAVAKLLSAIKENGYQVMFLSARAIGHACYTRYCLKSVDQGGQQLPDGPVVVSSERSIPAAWREIILREPETFKIPCLEDIKCLFPPERKPLYAGFGNHKTDALSYGKAGVPEEKIFIVNPKGEVTVKVNNQLGTESYTSLHKRVHDEFPAIRH